MSWSLRRSHARRTLAVCLGCLCLALGAYQIWGANGYRALRRKQAEQRQWEARNETLRRQNEELQKRIHELRTDPKAIEKIAREELLLVHPNDKIILAPQKK